MCVCARERTCGYMLMESDGRDGDRGFDRMRCAVYDVMYMYMCVCMFCGVYMYVYMCECACSMISSRCDTYECMMRIVGCVRACVRVYIYYYTYP